MPEIDDKDFRLFKNDFQKSVDLFFGKTIQVDERVLRSVCIWRGGSRNGAKHPRPLHVWSALEQEMPLIHQLYENLGVAQPRENEMGFPKADRRIITPDVYNGANFVWAETLESIFGNPKSDDFTIAGVKTRESGRLGINELITALLEFNDEQARSSTTPFIRLKSTLLTQLAKRNPEITSKRNWLRLFSENAIQKWSAIFDLERSLGTNSLSYGTMKISTEFHHLRSLVVLI
jgi:hypothetical protein